MAKFLRGALCEYTFSETQKFLEFAFNPESISSSYGVQMAENVGVGSGFDFKTPSQADRAAQGVTKKDEVLTLKILIDATDRIEKGNKIAETFGIQPELATLRSMVEPKKTGNSGSQMLASLGASSQRAVDHEKMVSVYLFCWGSHVNAVFVTQVEVNVSLHSKELVPLRASADITLQIIANNPFYNLEDMRRQVLSKLNIASTGIRGVLNV